MAKRLKDKLKACYDKRTACQVLGCMMHKPKLALSVINPIDENDFMGGLHKTLFESIYYLAQEGIKQITLTDIENYLSAYRPLKHDKIFNSDKMIDTILGIIEDAQLGNYEYYYNMLRKYSLLRSYMEVGIDVSEILDFDEIDINITQHQLKEFENTSIKNLVDFFDRKNILAKKNFVGVNQCSRRKCGEGIRELLEEMKQGTRYGFSLESLYLNSIMHGAVKGTVMLETRDSGMGRFIFL